VSDTWIGKTIGNCRIEERIGAGGCGQVFRGVDLMLDRPVAIKVLHPALAARSDVTHRFRSEAHTLARLSHPNVATVYSFLLDGDAHLLVMEYVEGETLESLIRREGGMSPQRALPLFLQALDGIHHAHQLGVVHRDVKSSNVMVTGGGLVKVMDFGVARALGSAGITEANQPIGTPEFMAPEQVRGEEIDARSDVYALGILLFKLLSGRLPVGGRSPFDVMRAQVEDPPLSIRTLVPTIPEAIERALDRALAKSPEDRLPSVDAFRALLEEAVDDPGYPLPPPAWAPSASAPDPTAVLELATTSRRGTRRLGWRALASACVLAVLCGFAWLGDRAAARIARATVAAGGAVAGPPESAVDEPLQLALPLPPPPVPPAMRDRPDDAKKDSLAARSAPVHAPAVGTEPPALPSAPSAPPPAAQPAAPVADAPDASGADEAPPASPDPAAAGWVIHR
jgi:eukaryotic-like serine/threonine-protein kinase